MRTRRNVELGLLVFAMVIITAYAISAEGALTGKVRPDVWVQPMLLLLVFFGLTLVVRKFARIHKFRAKLNEAFFKALRLGDATQCRNFSTLKKF